MHIDKAQRVQVMLDAVANEDTLTTDFLQVLSDLCDSWCVTEPAHADAMQSNHASRDDCLRVDECVEDEAAILIND